MKLSQDFNGLAFGSALAVGTAFGVAFNKVANFSLQSSEHAFAFSLVGATIVGLSVGTTVYRLSRRIFDTTLSSAQAKGASTNTNSDTGHSPH